MNKSIVSLSILFLLFVFGCGNKQTKEKVEPKQEEEKVAKQVAIVEVKDFVEGVLYYKMTISDEQVNDFVQYAVEDPVMLTAMLEKYKQKKDGKTVDYLQTFFKKNPQFWTTYGQLPFIKNNVYVAGYEAVYKGEALTYIYENKWNDILNQGFGYLNSTVGMSSKVNLTFKKPYIGMEQMQIKIDTINYDKEHTGKIVNFVGYDAEEIIYRLKANKRTQEFIRPEIVTAYVSPSFNGSINKVSPFFVDEKYGVLKVETALDAADGLKVTYEVDGIVARKLIDEETSILQTKALFLTTDEQSINAMRLYIAKLIATPKM